MNKKLINIEFDRLTNSIENRITGDSFDTKVIEIEKSDLTNLKAGWNFNWIFEIESKSKVFKLIVENNKSVLQGLISLTYKEGFVFVELVESTDFNIGRNKVYYGVAGNLFAFACKQSWDNGNFGYVAFNAKTNLIEHYKNSIGAKRIGNSNQMIIEPLEASELINKYYKD